MTNSTQKPKAELVAWTSYPLETLYFIWMQSRSNDPIPTPYMIEGGYYDTQPTLTKEEVLAICKQLLDEDIPVLENISFTFYLTNIPVSLREQLVRHRIGVEVGPLQGIDQIPELGKSTFWSQTSRMVSQGDFYTNKRFYLPDSLQSLSSPDDDFKYNQAQLAFDEAMDTAQQVYNDLIELGVPMEDARQVLPLAATQSMTWTLNLKAIKHILGKRACWIAQYNLWASIITDMVDELCSKVSPIFRSLVQPPCMEKGKFKSCPIAMVNVSRLRGEDPYPPCPIWATNAEGASSTDIATNTWHFTHQSSRNLYKRGLATDDPQQAQMMTKMREQFEKTWKLSADTGESL